MRLVSLALVAIAVLLFISFTLGALGNVLGSAIHNPTAQAVVFGVFDLGLIAAAIWVWRRWARAKPNEPAARSGAV